MTTLTSYGKLPLDEQRREIARGFDNDMDMTKDDRPVTMAELKALMGKA